LAKSASNYAITAKQLWKALKPRFTRGLYIFFQGKGAAKEALAGHRRPISKAIAD
jgi:hypothetical protein